MQKTRARSVIVDLYECVIEALRYLSPARLRKPKRDLHQLMRCCSRPLVVGSGNAGQTGRILFEDIDAVFADESTYRNRLKAIKAINSVILVSASGGKHAVEIAKYLSSRKRRRPLTLLTCNKRARAGRHVDKIIVFPHRPEPYTYNTSTYMGMILAKTGENPQGILAHIGRVVEPALKDYMISFANSQAFFLLVPEKFDLVRYMLTTKFVELFGRRLARDVFTWEQAKHATTLVPYDSELFISFGGKNRWWGSRKQRLYVPLPKDAGYAAMMAIGYYVIGKIQAAKPPWFKESVARYCETAAKWFGTELPVIVEYNRVNKIPQ